MTEVSSELGGITLFGVIAALVLWISWRQRFFQWDSNGVWNQNILLRHVVGGFFLYFGVTFTLGPIYVKLLKPDYASIASQVGYNAWLTFLLSASILAMMYFWWRCLSRTVRSNIWRSDKVFGSYSQDLKFGFYGWCVAFPLVLFVNKVFEVFLFLLTGIQQIPDQLAVRFVKMTAAYPFFFLLAILSIAIIAPVIEEFLFRGLLQTYIRKHLGPKQAIFITAICFAFFHFSSEQKLGNISIIASLFPLSLILGYIYERQRSLLAPIWLHAIFNTMSIINLYFMGGIPCAQ